MHVIKIARLYDAPQHISRPTAAVLDRLADAELQHGHHARAEELAALALAMREAGR